ncbi:MFS general substrate transporter [Aureobasidium pullulans]|uniref:MFS general substrate transporter n=1 Tax=Aureobasidium pullulans TaxID=5580 RepID=A0A4T0BJC8_AURPU|nr:MFS general substrate transporter [Aureobasidium pullulans]
MSSPLQTHQSLRHEQTQGGESTSPVSAEANHNTALERNDKQHYIGEATESVHDVSRSTSHDQVASSIGEDDTRDLEASIAEPPYTVFTSSQKRFIVLLTACAGFFSAVSANIYFPALNSLTKDFNVSSTQINLTLTTYMIFQGIAPTIMGDLADMAGRRPAYFVCFVIYIGACIGIALCQDYASLLILRCLQATGCAATIALGSGVVADIATSAERGTFMGYVTSGPMVAPALGPVLGGILAQFLGWRSIFWFLVILSACYLVPFLIAFPETGRNVVGNGSIKPQSWNRSLINYLHERKVAKAPALTRTVTRESIRLEEARLAKARKLRIPNPLKTLKIVFEKDTGLLLLYNSLVYTAFYDVTASMPYLFGMIYNYNDLQIGLCFIPFGIGCLIAPILGGRALDWNFRRLALKHGFPVDKKRATDLKDFPLEKARIQVTWPLVVVGDAALLCYGWVMHVETNLAAPLVLLFFIGLCLTGAFNCNSVMLIDLYPLSPSTATAANNLVRCFMGAGGTAIIIIMIESMGRGWCFTFIAAVVMLFSPILWVLEKYGQGWRNARTQRLEEEQAKKQKAEQEEKAEELDAYESHAEGRDKV